VKTATLRCLYLSDTCYTYERLLRISTDI